MKINFFLYSLFCIIITSCSQVLISDNEIITIQLPQWPPSNSKVEYPELSRWIIKSGTSVNTSLDYLSPTTKIISFAVKKNQPFCATLLPITKTTQNGKEIEISYFQPAGYLYPFKNSLQEFTWEQGYLADSMLKIMDSKNETGLSSENINDCLCTFNWKKAQKAIEEKIQDYNELSIDTKFYNPWLIDTTNFLENLSYGYFKSTYLNNINCYSVNINTLFSQSNSSRILTPLSSFIPENNFLNTTKQITLKKNTPTLLSDGKTFGVVITVHSSKNISKELIIMPIYIADI